MKQFQKVRDQILQYITANSGGLWYTIGYRGQARNADDQRGQSMIKAVVVGLAPDKGASSMNGEKTCRVSIDCEITVTAKSTLDISGLEDVNSSDAHRAEILSEVVDAENNANNTMDQIFARLFDLFMGGDGEWFGLPDNSLTIADRWGDDFRKEKIERYGSTVVLTGYVGLSCTVIEVPLGAIPTNGEKINGIIDIEQGSGTPLAVENEV